MARLIDVNPYTMPALTSLTGEQSTLVDPPSSQKWLLSTGVLCLTLSFVFISARTFVTTYILEKTQIEDYALIFAGLAFAAHVGVAITAGNAGQGQHLWSLSIAQAMRAASLDNIVAILYGPAMFPAKLCVLVQMMRIFRGTKKDSVYWTILILIWLNFAFYLTVSFGLIFTCVPRSQLSAPIPSASCMRRMNPYILATSAINIASDFSILLLPVFAVWKLKVALKKKLTISAVFGTGLFACISSIIRLVYTVRLTLTRDKTWAVTAVLMWGFAEFTTVILAGALPTIPRLIQWLRGYKRSPPYLQPSQKPSKPSYLVIGNDLADVEAAHRVRRVDMVMETRKSYISPEEDMDQVAQGCETETQRSLLGNSLPTPSNNEREAKEGTDRGDLGNREDGDQR